MADGGPDATSASTVVPSVGTLMWSRLSFEARERVLKLSRTTAAFELVNMKAFDFPDFRLGSVAKAAGWSTKGPHVGAVIMRRVIELPITVDDDYALVVAYLSPNVKHPFLDEGDNPAALYRVIYGTGPLKGQTQDLEEWELRQSRPPDWLSRALASAMEAALAARVASPRASEPLRRPRPQSRSVVRFGAARRRYVLRRSEDGLPRPAGDTWPRLAEVGASSSGAMRGPPVRKKLWQRRVARQCGFLFQSLVAVPPPPPPPPSHDRRGDWCRRVPHEGDSDRRGPSTSPRPRAEMVTQARVDGDRLFDSIEEEEAHKTEARLALEDRFKAFQAVHRLRRTRGFDEVLYWCTLTQIQLILERIDLNELWDRAAATHRNGIRADEDGFSVTLGLTARRNKLSKFGQLDVGQELMHLCNRLLSAAGCNTKFTSVEIHAGCRFIKHKDHLNDGRRSSLIVAFGTHTSGGGLFVWKDGADAAPTLHDINGVPLYFDGKNHFHMTQPWEGGRRFSLAFYTPMACRNEITDSVDEDYDSFAARHCTCPTLCDVRIGRCVDVYWQGDGVWYRGYIDDQRPRGGRVALRVAYDDGEKKYHVLQDEPFSGDGTPAAFDEAAGDPEPFRFVPEPGTLATPSRKRNRCWACENCRKKKGRAHPCLNPPGA